MGLTQFDKDNIGDILVNPKHNWFTAKLLRLIAGADLDNRRKLSQVFPDEVSLINNYQHGYDFLKK